MTKKQDMPMEIWACIDAQGYAHWVDEYPVWGGSTKYTRALELDAAHDMIKYLLPLAKGYVHANPGIKSTENIIEDAEAMLSQHLKGVW